MCLPWQAVLLLHCLHSMAACFPLGLPVGLPTRYKTSLPAVSAALPPFYSSGVQTICVCPPELSAANFSAGKAACSSNLSEKHPWPLERFTHALLTVLTLACKACV